MGIALEIMKNVTSKDGTKIVYDIHGSGPVLIYITGAICFRNFPPIQKDVKIFSEEFTVYNYDRRGRGDSEDTCPYTVEKELDDIEALIKTVGGPVFLYGHSSGAVLALEAALKMPTKISKIAIYDPAYAQNEKDNEEYLKTYQKVKHLLAEGKNARALRSFLAGIGMPKIFTYMLALMPGWKTMKALAPTLVYDMLLTSEVPPAKMSKVSVPTQIIYGQNSPLSIQNVSAQLAQIIPQSSLMQIDKQDHMVSARILLPKLKSFFKAEV